MSRGVLAFGTATLLALCCAGNAAAAEPGPAHSAGAVSTSIPWGPCVPRAENLQCARIRVPLDWDRPNVRTISLAVIRLLASKPQQRIGTMFINPGGPGDTGVGLLQGDPGSIRASAARRPSALSQPIRSASSTMIPSGPQT